MMIIISMAVSIRVLLAGLAVEASLVREDLLDLMEHWETQDHLALMDWKAEVVLEVHMYRTVTVVRQSKHSLLAHVLPCSYYTYIDR